MAIVRFHIEFQNGLPLLTRPLAVLFIRDLSDLYPSGTYIHLGCDSSRRMVLASLAHPFRFSPLNVYQTFIK